MFTEINESGCRVNCRFGNNSGHDRFDEDPDYEDSFDDTEVITVEASYGKNPTICLTIDHSVKDGNDNWRHNESEFNLSSPQLKALAHMIRSILNEISE